MGTAYIHYGSADNPPMQTSLVRAKRVKPGKPWRGNKPSVFKIKRFSDIGWQNVYERFSGIRWHFYAIVNGAECPVTIHGTEID